MNFVELQSHLANELEASGLIMSDVAIARFLRDISLACRRSPNAWLKISQYLKWMQSQEATVINQWCRNYLGETYDRVHHPQAYEYEHGEG